ncbi:MAG: hypothetical protein HDR03_09790 [Lachnospiraceae bacterium]|nr:hypothetical protein [Lachnospiraceae bacterium]
MDKFEYKVRADEIESLIAEGEFAEAVKIADTIDWRRVRSVRMLCTISDLYKINRRYQESKDILLLAYDKHPSGKSILYSLCELSIKMEDFLDAVKYYKEFVQAAPKDTGKYVLLYRLYEAQDVSLEERIAILEEFKKREYREKWAYELAYLYHRIGLTTKCIEECDEMDLWFGEGKYVLKALELKALHVPLSAEQQEKYNEWIRQRDLEMTEGYGGGQESEDIDGDETGEQRQDSPYDAGNSGAVSEMADNDDIMSTPTAELPEVKTVDVGQYNTINLQMELAESLKEIMTEEEASQEENAQDMIEEEAQEKEPEAEVTPVSEDTPAEETSIAEQLIAPLLQETAELPDVSQDAQEVMEQIRQETITAKIPAAEISANTTENRTNTPSRYTKYDDVLSQEYDGQIRLVVPDEKVVEKQITGQLSIQDIMAEWEEMKKNNEQKRMEDVRKHILNRTGSLFADFDEATQNGLLEELEQAFVAAIMQESDKGSDSVKVINPPVPQTEAVSDATLQQIVNETIEEVKTPILPQDTVEDEVIQNAAEEDEAEVYEAEEIEESDDTESIEQKIEEEAVNQIRQQEEENAGTNVSRELTEDEEELFGTYAQHKKSRQQLINTLDNMSMAAYTGNVIITGEEDSTTMPLAKNLIREMQYGDSNFSGKVAKISAAALNKKDIAETLKRLNNGALIIENASELESDTVVKLNKVLENENIGLLLIMEDTKKRMNGLLSDNAILTTCFNLRIDIEPLDDEELVAYAKRYAEENEYSIDEFGVLALHTRIADMQTSDHEVSVSEVRELVDDAIYYANKKTPKHFVDILLAKRYDEDDMIILREKDFMHY